MFVADLFCAHADKTPNSENLRVDLSGVCSSSMLHLTHQDPEYIEKQHLYSQVGYVN